MIRKTDAEEEFRDRISVINIDEAHRIKTLGTCNGLSDAFRLPWGYLGVSCHSGAMSAMLAKEDLDSWT